MDKEVSLSIINCPLIPLHQGEYEMNEKPTDDIIIYLEEGRAAGVKEGRLEGREEGRLEGRDEGRLEGREERLRTDILEVLAVRFERVPADLEAQVGQVRGQKTLELLHRRAILVESLDIFAQELKRISS